MEIKIELGTKNNLDEIEDLYENVIDDLDNNINYPGWKKGIYPTRNEGIQGINNQELYVAYSNDKIVGTIIINHQQESNYHLAKWKINVPNNEVYVVHTLAVHPDYKGLKIAQQLLEYIEERAKERAIKTIRLDVRKGNEPAIKLYLKSGYTYVGEVNLDFNGFDIGLFELYEKIL